MDEVLTCKNCNKYFDEPVILPCEHSICKQHITTEKSRGTTIECALCKEKHEITDESRFINNKIAADLMKINWHLGKKVKEAHELVKKLESTINEVNLVTSDPYNYIYDQISDVRNKIDLERERLKEQIDKISQTLLDKLNQFEKDCKENLIKMDDFNKQINLDMIKSIIQCKEIRDELRIPKLNEKRKDELISELNKCLSESEGKLKEYKQLLLLNKELSFKTNNFNFDANMFGSFQMENINEGFSKSKILSGYCQISDFKKLCEFDDNFKCELIYQASRDGFGAEDFHRMCNSKSKTLTLIKSTKAFIFGGYTEAMWNENEDDYSNDRKAFIFSLINHENKPLKIKVCHSHYAIRNNQIHGPIFGGGHDIHIAANSNQNDSSYSNLSHSYKHPQFNMNSNKAKTYLAGTFNFMTEEIEVYLIK